MPTCAIYSNMVGMGLDGAEMAQVYPFGLIHSMLKTQEDLESLLLTMKMFSVKSPGNFNVLEVPWIFKIKAFQSEFWIQRVFCSPSLSSLSHFQQRILKLIFPIEKF